MEFQEVVQIGLWLLLQYWGIIEDHTYICQKTLNACTDNGHGHTLILSSVFFYLNPRFPPLTVIIS